MRGNLSYEGIGFQAATFKAGEGIKALVAAANRDAVVNMAVVLSAADTVDLGTDGKAIFGFIDVYEDDGHCTVQFRGYREGVPTNATPPTATKLVAVDGAGKVKDLPVVMAGTDAVDLNGVLRAPACVNVDATEGVATVFLG